MLSKFTQLSVGIIFLGLLSLSASASEHTTINWIIYEQTPYFIAKGKMKGKGIGDQILKKFIDTLPTFSHVVKLVNLNRYNKEIVKPNTCVPVAWLSPIEKGMLHSKPHSIEPPMGIYALNSRQDIFGKRGQIHSLASLLEKNDLVLGAIQGMQYGSRADSLIKDYNSTKRVLILNTRKVELRLKLLGRRVDYLLGMPSQLFNETNESERSLYQFYNIKEIDNYIDLFAHCSNDENGKKVIKIIDDILTPKYLAEMLGKYEVWYGTNILYRKIYEQHVIDGHPHSLVKRLF